MWFALCVYRVQFFRTLLRITVFCFCFCLSLFAVQMFRGVNLLAKFVKKKNEGVHFGRSNILHLLTRHNFLRVLPPLKNVLPPFCPPGEKKLATPLLKCKHHQSIPVPIAAPSGNQTGDLPVKRQAH